MLAHPMADPAPPTVTPDVDALAAEARFSGVVRVDRGGELVLERAYGLADRRWGVANAADTRFGIASGLKGMTALVVVEPDRGRASDAGHARALRCSATIFRSSRTT